MGTKKGAKRRRKNATDNLYGNLYKAQFGKATKNLRLGIAPKASTFNKIPNSLKRLQQLQAAAEMQEQGLPTQKYNPEVEQKCDKSQKIHANKKVGKTKLEKEEVNKNQQSQQQNVGAGNKTQLKQFKFDGSIATKSSNKKQKRKERLKQKQAEKDERMKAYMPHEKEQQIDDVRFGEVISAPPKINLKRKHWSNENRCTQLFKEQMSKAQQQLQQEKEKLRWKVVDAYRGLKLKGKEPQKANMESLKQLVQKTEEIQQQMVRQG